MSSIYSDSTPDLHVGDSAFEDWYQQHPKAVGGDKQLARDAYAAGMGDPLVVAKADFDAFKSLLTVDEFSWLVRFNETCEDDQPYDVPKAVMSRLADVGVIVRGTKNNFSLSSFGRLLVDLSSQSARDKANAQAMRDYDPDKVQALPDVY